MAIFASSIVAKTYLSRDREWNESDIPDTTVIASLLSFPMRSRDSAGLRCEISIRARTYVCECTRTGTHTSRARDAQNRESGFRRT